MSIKNLKRCPCCNRDMNIFDKKGRRSAIVFSYEAVRTYIQLKCECGIQTKKIHILDQELLYDIWNKRG